MSTTRSTGPTAPATRTPGPRWAESTLLVVGHGSQRTRAEDTAAFSHAGRLRNRGLFAEVRACFLRATPELAETVRGLSAPVVYVAPFLMADGLAARDGIGAALTPAGGGTRARPRAFPRCLRCEPVGLHPGLAQVIAARVETICREHGLAPDRVSVLLAAHGTPRNPASRLATQAHVERVAAQGRFARVGEAFLEEPPFLRDAVAERAGTPLIVVGLFAEPGAHGEEDVPRVLAEFAAKAASSSFVHYAGPIGTEPGLADLVLDQVRACDAEAAQV